MQKINKMADMIINKMYDYMADDIEKVNTKELGEVADILKDLHMIKYYMLLNNAMETEGAEETLEMFKKLNEDGKKYYTPLERIEEPGKIYTSARDEREGKAFKSRKTYMETMEIHKTGSEEDRKARMIETEKYINDLTADIMEMYHNAAPDEKQNVKNKITMLLQKL